MVGKEIALGHVTLIESDKLVVNHKDNRGVSEGELKDNSPLWVDDYELVTHGENTIHGNRWNKAYNVFGLRCKFSALDKTFMDIIEMSCDREQFLEHCKVQGINIRDYIYGRLW